MAKRKRGGADPGASSASRGPPATPKESGALPALSKNWLELQATLGKQSKGASARKRKRTERYPAAEGAASGGDAEKLDGAPFSLGPTNSDCSVTRVLALDCEMVGIGSEGKRNALARVSIVNAWGNVVYDTHVRPPEYVTDFRTHVSGVRACDLRKARDFLSVQTEVSELLHNRILVGHALHNDLKVLLLSHPRKDIRDTQLYGPFQSSMGRPQSLKHLVAMHLGGSIQRGEHDSVEDARAALSLYNLSKKEWEEKLKQRRKAGMSTHLQKSSSRVK